jgi:hypothetical protein
MNESIYVYTKFQSKQSLHTQHHIPLQLFSFSRFTFSFEIWDRTVTLVCQNLLKAPVQRIPAGPTQWIVGCCEKS